MRFSPSDDIMNEEVEAVKAETARIAKSLTCPADPSELNECASCQ